MRFDLRTIDGTKKFLIDWLGVDENILMNYVICNCNEIDVNDFCEVHGINLNEVETDHLTYVASHVTTCTDELESIKKHGLMNLQLALTLSTPLNIYLRSHGIEFDIGNQIMRVGSESYDVSYNSDSYNGFLDSESFKSKLKDIGHKLFYDNQISAFLAMEGDKEYGGYVHQRPEFLFNVSKVSKRNLEYDWTKKSKAFVLEYEEKFENFEWFTFYENEDEYHDDYFRNEHKKWLISKSLYRLWNDFFYNDVKEEYAYMKSSYVIPWKNIINIREIV
ncbi:hypothetical protein [Paenibacillus woosongensis]|uniref:Uncharacterized protein n=1 Tax=Paenibacillus woosongensis TaxID=307580 RepID=A0A7X2Z2D9_9BACL|nr:hypothetical protein [Paenibacillus woosongensis]MUG46314.1 hypothetical protein [Paenibacillus woosongensis]